MSDLLSPDATPIGEILQGPSKFELFLEKNQKLLLVSTIVIATAIGGYSISRSIKEDTHAEAAAALISANDIAQLESVSKDFSDSPSAATAEYLLAVKLWENGQQDASVSALRDVISKHAAHPVTSIARIKLANQLAAQGKTEDAASIYEEIVNESSSSYIAPNALIALGDLAAKRQDLEKAKDYYNLVATKYDKSDQKSTAIERTNFLSFAEPVEVEPPPPPPPASIALPEPPQLPKLDPSILNPSTLNSLPPSALDNPQQPSSFNIPLPE